VYSTDLAYVHDAGFRDLAEGAAPEIVRLLRGHGITSGRIVEAGCGSGVLARHLVEAGYDVTGFDASPAMIRLARANASGARQGAEARSAKATFRVAPIERARIPPCAAVIATGEVITYARSFRPFFRRVSAALPTGGLFIFDFIESAERRTYPPKSRAGADWAIVLEADVNPAGTILTRRITVFRKIAREYRQSHETHRIRIYSREDVGEALSAAGFVFRMRRSYGSYRLLPGDVAVVAVRQ
jgi:SAM-dependent methyltransferase